MIGAVMDEQEQLMPIRNVMARIGDECRDLGEFTDRFQHTLSPVLAHLRMDERCHKDVQSLDALSQSLTSLANYIREIVKVLPEEYEVNTKAALASVQMSELQRRLRGAPLSEEPDYESGELELF